MHLNNRSVCVGMLWKVQLQCTGPYKPEIPVYAINTEYVQTHLESTVYIM